MRAFYLLIVGIVFHLDLFSQQQPNILWIVCEDISPTLSMYGDSISRTPNLDALAADAVVFDRAFATVGVCGPSRSSIITGMYPTSIGTMHMRSAKDVNAHGSREYKADINKADLLGQPILEYSVVLPESVKCFTELLRSHGYYCTNNQKTDYQFAAPLTAWDENSIKAHWRNRPSLRMPFFSVFNFSETHESRLWLNDDQPLSIDSRAIFVPPYLPDTDIVRRDLARHYTNIELMDKKVGQLVQLLKDDGLYDQTIIFFYSDHGGPMPRQKRETNDRGLRVPLMIKDIDSHTYSRSSRLVSLVDLAPTVLNIAGIKPPAHMQGIPFWGTNASKVRSYVFGSGDRFDEHTDRIRVIRTDSFLYVRNAYEGKPAYLDLEYRKLIPSMQQLLELRDKDALTADQSSWFAPKKKEELYQVHSDFQNMYNVASSPINQATLQKLSALMDQHLATFPDKGLQAERDMIFTMWPNGDQPKVESPTVKIKKNQANAKCKTRGHSIAYIITDKPIEGLDRNLSWQLYTQSVFVPRGKYINFVAERTGFMTSDITTKGNVIKN